ncbi:hypothetical protein AMTR_s00048p00113910 [Amborella trichopoda]|uniref:Xyloglucan endotransglucosylase/hydrolase n=1 Tax=Amborella trichopoda TaxID=13333 RepID=U5CZG1_AMBTC|nr:hypothetical protein AMTR_s00048p00113910 [Amborella trichopoda]
MASRLSLEMETFKDHRTDAVFVCSSMNPPDLYMHGYFSADIKLPSDYTAGVVVAFYTSNGDIFEKNHDELDFEFLGNIRGKDWRIQTNVYGNGSTSRGREERYNLWFDPTNGFHRYSILWTQKHIIFYIDSVPIREVVRTPAMGGDYPSKPMSVYATIWDGSNWATNGGRYKANYKYAPFTAEFSNLVLKGRPSDPIEQISAKSSESGDSFGENTELAHAQRLSMNGVRHRHMTYSYCYDRARYPEPPSECVVIPSEQKRFKDTGRVKFGNGHRRHGKRRTRNPMPESDHKSASI